MTELPLTPDEIEARDAPQSGDRAQVRARNFRADPMSASGNADRFTTTSAAAPWAADATYIRIAAHTYAWCRDLAPIPQAVEWEAYSPCGERLGRCLAVSADEALTKFRSGRLARRSFSVRQST